MSDMRQDLVETLARVQRALAFDFRIVPVAAPDAPIFLAVSVPLNPAVTGTKPRLPSGRGLTQLQAMISSGAEALELRASLAQSHALAIADLPRLSGQAMVQAHDLLSGQAAPLPAQDVYLDCAAVTGERMTTDARSTGCACASTLQDAQRMALFEAIERDAVAFWWHGGVAANALSKELIDTREPRLSWWLERRPRRLVLLGLTTDLGLPVVLAVSSDPDGRHIVTGSAARFDIGSAALAAVTEMIQMEVSFDRALAADHAEARAWLDYASGDLPQFTPSGMEPPTSGYALDDDTLLKRLAGLGLRALTVDLTLPGDPLYCARVLVPGLCDMGGRIDRPRFRQARGILDPAIQLTLHDPEPF